MHGAPRRPNSAVRSTSRSRHSSPSGNAPRKSSPIPPAPANRRPRPSTACGAAASASSYAVSRPRPSLRRSAPSSRPRAPTIRPRRPSSRRSRGRRPRLRRPRQPNRHDFKSRPKSAGRASPLVERNAQALLASQLDEVLAQRTQTESLLTGGGRDALLALRGAVQTLGVRHESADRLLGELRRELEDARRVPAARRPPSSDAPPTRPTAKLAPPLVSTRISKPGSPWRVNA